MQICGVSAISINELQVEGMASYSWWNLFFFDVPGTIWSGASRGGGLKEGQKEGSWMSSIWFEEPCESERHHWGTHRRSIPGQSWGTSLTEFTFVIYCLDHIHFASYVYNDILCTGELQAATLCSASSQIYKDSARLVPTVHQRSLERKTFQTARSQASEDGEPIWATCRQSLRWWAAARRYYLVPGETCQCLSSRWTVGRSRLWATCHSRQGDQVGAMSNSNAKSHFQIHTNLRSALHTEQELSSSLREMQLCNEVTKASCRQQIDPVFQFAFCRSAARCYENKLLIGVLADVGSSATSKRLPSSSSTILSWLLLSPIELSCTPVHRVLNALPRPRWISKTALTNFSSSLTSRFGAMKPISDLA